MWRSHFKIHSFALDVSEANLRLVQLKKSGSGIKLVSFGQIDLPEGCLVNGQVKDSAKIVSQLKQLIHQVTGQYILTHYVRVCLPEPKSFIKLVELVYPNSPNVEEEISGLISQHFPYNAEEVYWDWQYFKPADKTKILLGVCPKNIIDDYQDILEQAGLYPLSLEIEAEAIVRSIIQTYSSTSGFVLDLGARHSSLIAFTGANVSFTVSLPLSGQKLSVALMKNLKVSAEEAEVIKYRGLLWDRTPDAYHQALEAYFQPLVEQIRRAEKFQQSNFSSLPLPQGLMISGGLSQMPGLIEYLQKNLLQPVVIANPLIKINKVIKNFPLEKSNSYATAIGLALHEYSQDA